MAFWKWASLLCMKQWVYKPLVVNHFEPVPFWEWFSSWERCLKWCLSFVSASSRTFVAFTSRKLLSAAALFIRGHHSRQLGTQDAIPKRFMSPPATESGNFCLLGKCVHSYTIKFLLKDEHSPITIHKLLSFYQYVFFKALLRSSLTYFHPKLNDNENKTCWCAKFS